MTKPVAPTRRGLPWALDSRYLRPREFGYLRNVLPGPGSRCFPLVRPRYDVDALAAPAKDLHALG